MQHFQNVVIYTKKPSRIPTNEQTSHKDFIQYRSLLSVEGRTTQLIAIAGVTFGSKTYLSDCISSEK